MFVTNGTSGEIVSDAGSYADFEPLLPEAIEYDETFGPLAHVSKTFATGFPAIDALFSASDKLGVPNCRIVELLGESNVGKSRLITYIAAANAVLGNKILVIQTGQSLHVDRVSEVMEYLISAGYVGTPPNASRNDMLSCISLAQVSGPWNLLSVLTNVSAHEYALVILDSLDGILGPYFCKKMGRDLKGEGVSIDSLFGEMALQFKRLSLTSSVFITTLLSKQRLAYNSTHLLSSFSAAEGGWRHLTRILPDYLFADVFDTTLLLRGTGSGLAVHVDILGRAVWFDGSSSCEVTFPVVNG